MSAGRKPWVWTEERRRAVQADVQPGRTAAEIADKHGLSQRSVEAAFARGQVLRLHDASLIERECLSCGKAFFTDTPFVRRCCSCKEKGDVYSVGWIG